LPVQKALFHLSFVLRMTTQVQIFQELLT
jgi:hypothetical protein